MEDTTIPVTERLPDKRIAAFIRRHHVMTLATVSVEHIPYCANLFYAYVPGENYFVVTSAETTRHGAEAAANFRIAASIVLETRMVGNIQGLQIQGEMVRPDAAQFPAVRKQYLKRFPYATVMDLELWIITPTFLKLTDNRLGFGRKLIWTVAENPVFTVIPSEVRAKS